MVHILTRIKLATAAEAKKKKIKLFYYRREKGQLQRGVGKAAK